MSRSRVAIVKGTDPKLITHHALDLTEADKIVRHKECVLIKPNCVSPKDPSTGVTTDPRVVEAIIEFLRDKGVKDVIIGDGGPRNTDKIFDMIGIRNVAKRYGAKLVNFNDDEGVEVEIPSAIALHKVPIAKTILESSFIINVPKLKIHHMAQVTLSIKNLMGTIVGDRGAIMHRQIDEKLVDLASYVKPKLNIIDGIVGCEMDEVKGESVPMNLIIAGTDMVATDAVGAAVMGVDPRIVRHLQLAEKRGLGTAQLDTISIVGESIESVRKNFRTCFSKEKLREYGFDYYVSDEVLRPLFETIGSNLPKKKRQG